MKKAIRAMYRQTGACRFDMDGKIQKGVIVRHLLLPGELKAAKRIVQYLYAVSYTHLDVYKRQIWHWLHWGILQNMD